MRKGYGTLRVLMDELRLLEERIFAECGECRLYGNEGALFHNAIELGGALAIRVRLPRRLGTYGLWCVLVGDAGELARYPMRYCGIVRGMDLYECRFSPSEVGLYFYSFIGEGIGGRFFGMRAFGPHRVSFSRLQSGAHFQLSVTDYREKAPQWLVGGIIYHVFVDRFARGGDHPIREDAVIKSNWEEDLPSYPAYRGGPMKNNDFFCGTLDGIADHIEDIAALGVSCIYLSPINEAHSNHRYDTGDYEKIDPMLGGEEALRRLVDRARGYGIRILLDGVFNHSGADSIYFNKYGRYPSLGAYQSKESPYFPWYRFSEHPDGYESWWGIDTLPRLNPDEPSLRRFFTGEGGVIDRYARYGIGGIRLDVVDELSDGFVRDIRARLLARLPDAVLYGEVWEDASHKVAYGVRRRYYLGDELDGVMNYPLRTGLIEYLREGQMSALLYALSEVMANMPKRAADLAMNLLGSHDTERILTALVGECEDGQGMDELAKKRLSRKAYHRSARLLVLGYLVLATLPGIPTVYYGDEVGMQGYRDPFNRMPYPWHRRDPWLYSSYCAIGKMRRSEPLLCDGDFFLHMLDSGHMIFSRRRGRRVLLTVINRTEEGIRLCFDREVTPLFGGSTVGKRQLVPPLSGAVISAEQGASFFVLTDDGLPILPSVRE